MRAKTHTSEFLIHKYWGRKAYSTLSSVLEGVVQPGMTFWDPFCGSGAPSVVASRLGASVIANDINPIACAITRVACSTRVPQGVTSNVETIAKETEELLGQYSADGDTVRYFVHARVGLCPKCHVTIVPQDVALARECSCGERLKYPESRVVESVIVAAELELGGFITQSHAKWPSIVSAWERLNNTGIEQQCKFAQYDAPFVNNRRTLTRSDIGIRRYFTPFAFVAMCTLAESIRNLDDDESRDVALIMLTSAAAQASRLIPYRNNMSTGGPAWSIPGFWVPPVHLECNPFLRLKTRIKKVTKGLHEAVSRNKTAGPVRVFTAPASVFPQLISFRADVVFLDPPYAGDVPYLEFSALWNSFLTRGKVPDYGNEIVVSDRLDFRSSKSDFQRRLREALLAINDSLTEKGTVVLTFNGLDLTAWNSMIGALQAIGLEVQEAHFFEPAVKSSKAQFAPSSSYVGDFIAILKRGARMFDDMKSQIDLAVKRLFALRRNEPQPINRVRTAAILALLRTNAHADDYLRVDDTIVALCHRKDSSMSLRDATESLLAEPYFPELIAKAARQLGSGATPSQIANLAMALDSGAAIATWQELETLARASSSKQMSLY